MVKNDKLYDLTIALIKGIVHQEVLALIKRENQESGVSEHDDIQEEAVQPSQPPRKKTTCRNILKTNFITKTRVFVT